MNAKVEKTLRKYEIRLLTARAALMQVWEKYGETNKEVLAAAVHFDKVMNKYNRFLQKIGGHVANTHRSPAESFFCSIVGQELQHCKDCRFRNQDQLRPQEPRWPVKPAGA